MKIRLPPFHAALLLPQLPQVLPSSMSAVKKLTTMTTKVTTTLKKPPKMLLQPLKTLARKPLTHSRTPALQSKKKQTWQLMLLRTLVQPLKTKLRPLLK